MVKSLRILGTCLALLIVAARLEAASVTLAWDANAEPDIASYQVGYRTSATGTETVVDVGKVTTWTFTSATAGSTYYFRVFAQNTAGVRSAPSNEVSTTIPTTPPPPSGGGLAIERGDFNFGVVKSGATVTSSTPSQRMMITQTVSTATAWTITTSNARVAVTPASGTGTMPVTVSVAPGSAAVGTYNDTFTVRATAAGVNLTVNVVTRIYNAGTTTAPTGVFDTPTNGVTNVAGALPVTGWAVDDVNVARVDIFRDAVGAEPAGAQILLGSAALVAGSRPDVETLYPNAPFNYRAGWGFMVLTNMLPDLVNGRANGGNGSFRLHAYAIDAEGAASYLGAKTFSANNAVSVKPFGTLDTPTQGGTASGSAFMVWGWALSRLNTIPLNGSTMSVFVDGTSRGNVTYNNNRSDIATMFPGYANSNGAVGYFVLNTTTLTNGTHTISWVVTDNLGNTEGLGSRFFTVQNSSALTSAVRSVSTLALGSSTEAVGQTLEAVSEVAPDYSLVEVTRAASDEKAAELVFPEWTGEIQIRTRETEQVEVRLANQSNDASETFAGYIVVNGRMRPLPVGSALNPKTGVFTWQPGPGFLGRYRLIFIRTSADGFKTRISVDLQIAPKHDGDDQR